MVSFVSAEKFFLHYHVLNEDEKKVALEYVSDECDFGEFDVGFAYSHGALLIKYYSQGAGYHFEAPIPLSDCCDFSEAYIAISEYCKLQSVPEVIVGVPKEHKDIMLRGAEKYDFAEDEDGSLVIEVLTECMLADELPEIMCDDVYLGEFACAYASEYEKLVKNVNLNRYFGYNLTDDLPDGSGIDFINMVRDDFERGESMTFAATVLSEDGENVFIGEGTLYAFDGRGGASVAFRVLPEYHGRGFGKKIFMGLCGISDKIGVDTLFAEVMNENFASVYVLRRYTEPESVEDGKYKFIFDVKKIIGRCEF